MDLALLIGLTFGVAILYSSVGHGGASGYLAVMGLVGMASSEMKPTALILNLLVAGAGSVRYIRSGCFSWRSFWPFAVGSIPFAFIGGSHQLSEPIYKRLLGIVLIVAAIGMFNRWKNEEQSRRPPVPVGIAVGSGVGYLSGLFGVGGGIFLSPILILTRWATTKETLGIASLFIFVNSASGLAGNIQSVQHVPSVALYLAPTAFLGGLLGSWPGAKKLNTPTLRTLLAIVLVVASIKMFV